MGRSRAPSQLGIQRRDHLRTGPFLRFDIANFANVGKLRREDSECDRFGTCAEAWLSPSPCFVHGRFRGRGPRFGESIVSEELSRRKFVMSGAAIVAAGTGMRQNEALPRVAVRGVKPV